jgi:GNAT superfamily N-acetyltransferase
VGDVSIEPASVDSVRNVERRRGLDEAGFRLALEFAERGTAWVALDQGDAIGLALASESDDERYVADLFVEPSYRGQGVGAALLDAALAESGDATRSMLLPEDDRARLALALRRGLVPWGTVVKTAGPIPREDELLNMAAGDYRFDVDVLDPLRYALALAALDREVRGTARGGEHERFCREAVGLAFFSDGEFVGYAYVWPDGRLGPIATASAAYLVQVFAYSLVALQRRFAASWCTALIPGNNTRLARASLRAGLRIEDAFTIASDGPTPELARYAGYHPRLF